ncbi:MAG: hypothetical protein HFJ58_04180 [Clostridia bacterium]|nr:hypothetical protein [Clostridia bacterium]
MQMVKIGVGQSKDFRAFITECINNGDITSNSYCAGGITASNGEMGNHLGGYVCNSYNTGTISGGQGKKAGIVAQVKCRVGVSYVYNCYNRGNTNGANQIIGYDWGGTGSSISLNNYGATDATIEKLNKESDVEQALKDTGLYRVGVWKLKNGNIALDWE